MKTRIFLMTLFFLISFVSCKKEAASSEGTEVSVTETETLSGQYAVKDSESDPNALQVSKSIEDFSTLVDAIEAAGVEDAAAGWIYWAGYISLEYHFWSIASRRIRLRNRGY